MCNLQTWRNNWGNNNNYFRKRNSTIVFKDVPANICDNCGEKYVNDNITKDLLKKANELIKNGMEVDIRKF